MGWQSDEVIRDQLRHCRALLFPGEEDFGIVPIEALACGAPVIALARGGVAETVDNFVGRTYIQPTSDGLLDAMNTWEAQGCPHDPIEARLAPKRCHSPCSASEFLSSSPTSRRPKLRTRSPLPRI